MEKLCVEKCGKGWDLQLEGGCNAHRLLVKSHSADQDPTNGLVSLLLMMILCVRVCVYVCLWVGGGFIKLTFYYFVIAQLAHYGKLICVCVMKYI